MNSMQPFLEKTADYILKYYQENFGNLTVILPSKRAGLFLKKHLIRQISTATWSPRIFSIEDFIVEMSGLKIIDPQALLFELFTIHQKIERQNAKDFVSFSTWGQVMLHDFNEIDLHLADHEKLFRYLKDFKDIEEWNPDGSELTVVQARYLNFFGTLKDYYNTLSDGLLKKKQVYQGLAYRYLADQIQTGASVTDDEHFVFAGFNALTKAEELIIDSLVKANKAEIIWDADSYYVNDNKQEAGFFFRKYFAGIPSDQIKWIKSNLEVSEKKIEIIGVPQQVGQAKACGKILQDLIRINPDIGDTAIVLADENLLFPVLNSIPDQISDFNITMGLPLNQCSFFQFIDALFTLQENTAKFKNTSQGNLTQFYYKDILRILNDPYIRGQFAGNENIPVQISGIIQVIRSSNRIFYSASALKSLFNECPDNILELIKVIFDDWKNNSAQALVSLKRLADIYKDHFLFIHNSSKDSGNPKNNHLDLEYLYGFMKIVKRMESLFGEYGIATDTKGLRMVFNQMVSSSTIPFYGEPLQGLQIMGMLETRALDFKRLILLSVNEDIIPTSKHTPSFLTFEMRNYFGIPSYIQKNAVYAYHFYRLLQRSDEVYILYETEGGALGGGEKSRYLYQIINELPGTNPNIKITEKLLNIPLPEDKTDYSIQVNKNKKILEKIDQIAMYGFSASAFNTFRNCSLQFYFQYIAGLAEAEEVEETIDASTLGKVVHNVLKKLYEPLINEAVTVDLVKQMIPVIDEQLAKSFKENYQEGDVTYGKNLLILNVASQFIRHFLKKEILQLSDKANTLEIISLENLYKAGLKIPSDNEILKDKKIFIRGYIDRIDKQNGTVRIIDYKTGMVTPKELKINDWEDFYSDDHPGKSFQLLVYAWLYVNNMEKISGNLEAGIISFRNLSSGFMKVVFPGGDQGSENIEDVERILLDIITDMFNPDIPFNQTENQDNCKYCSFKSLCNRQ